MASFKQIMVCLSFGFICFTGIGYPQVEETENEANKKSHFLFPAPPLEYNLTSTSIVLEGKLIGFQSVLQKEGSIGKAIAFVDLRADADFSKRGFRSGGLKGYVNGLANNIQEAGYELKKLNRPDIDKSDLTDWTHLDLEFEKPDGSRVLVKKRVFFDSRGIDITVIAENEAELASLTEWADKIELTKETK